MLFIDVAVAIIAVGVVVVMFVVVVDVIQSSFFENGPRENTHWWLVVTPSSFFTPLIGGTVKVTTYGKLSLSWSSLFVSSLFLFLLFISSVSQYCSELPSF